MPPITKTSEESIKEALEETLKRNNEMLLEKIKSELEPGSSESTGSKITQILKQSKGQSHQQTSEIEEQRKKEEIDKELQKEKDRLEEVKKKEREEFDKVKEKLEKELEESEVYCPTCVGGHEHKHKLKKTDKGTMKCTGDNCGTEYAMIPTNADYVCETCNTPHKKPLTDIPNDNCPFCGDNKFIKPKIDYTKIREKVAKKKK